MSNMVTEVRVDYEKMMAQLLEENRRLQRENEALREKETGKKRAKERHSGAYSPIKSNGVRKAEKTDSIRSYSDYIVVKEYFERRGQHRDSLMWTMGICFGLRASDLMQLKFENLLNKDGTYRKRVYWYEKKTGKLNNLKITEAIRKAMSQYLRAICWDYKMSDYIFASQKGGALSVKSCWRILNQAQRDLGLPIHIGSHTMRRSFLNIAICVDQHTIDMNLITKAQGLANHSNAQTTMRYLGTLDTMLDAARDAVSDFCLGKTGVDELVLGVEMK